MQHADKGNLMSYLGNNINIMTWKMKLRILKEILFELYNIHYDDLVHCDLHAGNVVWSSDPKFEENDGLSRPFICDLGLSQLVESNATTIHGVLPYIAPEVFHTRKFTQKSDIYSFGILIYLIASGEPPFRDRQFDVFLARDICNGLRPTMPDSAPESYKKLADMCCDADPDKRPPASGLFGYFNRTLVEIAPDDNVWYSIYSAKNGKPLSRIEKESKYSSLLLPTGDLPKPRNSCDIYSLTGTMLIMFV